VNGIDPVIGGALGGLKRIAKDLYWRAYELFLIHPPVPPSARSLLFVCKGNICRSPFAEAMARRRIPDGAGIACRSAGIDVGTPEECPRETLAAAERFGIDLSGHRSQRIDQELVAGADMVFAMEAWQLTRLRKTFPRHMERMFLMPLFERRARGPADAGRLLNIRDPYGRNLEEFIECFERIDACLEGILSGIGGVRSRPPAEEARTEGRLSGEQAGSRETPRWGGTRE
jgi:protein-tyrosine phosphatase